MKDISRVNLYSKMIEFLNSRNNEYKWVMDSIGDDFLESLRYLLNLNVILLNDIEKLYLFNDLIEDGYFNKDKIISQFIENMQKILLDLRDIDKTKIIKLSEELQSAKDEYYVFNSLLSILNEINNEVLKNSKFNFIRYYKNNEMNLYNNKFNKRQPLNRVFLSHAFEDRLYTLCLFIYMLNNGIFLYVDWLFCEEFESGIEIKKNLEKELSLASQLLFLRTTNSELSIRGSGNIRGWCSWELGSFYTKMQNNQNTKFYIELYSPKQKRVNNKQLDGIRPLKKIKTAILE